MYVACCGVFFFFQAEDGIRDLVRSRGLGDVYKRQVPEGPPPRILHLHSGFNLGGKEARAVRLMNHWGAVSYTHLTLPTSDLV